MLKKQVNLILIVSLLYVAPLFAEKKQADIRQATCRSSMHDYQNLRISANIRTCQAPELSTRTNRITRLLRKLRESTNLKRVERELRLILHTNTSVFLFTGFRRRLLNWAMSLEPKSRRSEAKSVKTAVKRALLIAEMLTTRGGEFYKLANLVMFSAILESLNMSNFMAQTRLKRDFFDFSNLSLLRLAAIVLRPPDLKNGILSKRLAKADVRDRFPDLDLKTLQKIAHVKQIADASEKATDNLIAAAFLAERLFELLAYFPEADSSAVANGVARENLTTLLGYHYYVLTVFGTRMSSHFLYGKLRSFIEYTAGYHGISLSEVDAQKDILIAIERTFQRALEQQVRSSQKELGIGDVILEGGPEDLRRRPNRDGRDPKKIIHLPLVT